MTEQSSAEPIRARRGIGALLLLVGCALLCALPVVGSLLAGTFLDRVLDSPTWFAVVAALVVGLAIVMVLRRTAEVDPVAANPTGNTRRGVLIGVIFAVATVLFVWGALAESSDHHEVNRGSEGTSQEGTGENAEQHTNEAGRTETGAESDEFHPLGLDLESTPLVASAAIVSLAIAGMVAWRPTRGWLLAVVLLGLAFAVLEVVEVVHQSDENNTGLLILALAACITHALAAVLASNELRISGRAESALTG